MLFRQVLHDDLACASYVVADGRDAVVVDPKWEIEAYLALAEQHGFGIAHILETHTHADHVSGHGRLAQATGATVHVSREAGAEYPHEPLRDGDVLELGQIRIRAVATPGHRPDHLAFVVADSSRGDEPWLVLTGDCLFVDDVGRPDLAIEPDDGARDTYRSLQRLLELSDHVEVWPGHTGGSLCGGSAMSKKPSSTIGFERRHNRLLRLDDEDAFVRELTSKLQPQPPSFERLVELNRGPLVTDVAVLERIAPARLEQLLDEGAILLDGRAPREFDSAHVPGSINVTTTESGVGTRAAWVVDLEREVVVAASDIGVARRMGRLLEASGLRSLRGVLASGVPGWAEAGLPIETTPAIDPRALADRLRAGEVVLLDVREDDEWDEGHVEGSLHVPYHELSDRVPDDVRAAPNGKPLAVACSAGNRSSIAASLLRAAGLERVEHVVDGGVPDLAEAGIHLVSSK